MSSETLVGRKFFLLVFRTAILVSLRMHPVRTQQQCVVMFEELELEMRLEWVFVGKIEEKDADELHEVVSAAMRSNKDCSQYHYCYEYKRKHLS